jgi:hypothetical protein
MVVSYDSVTGQTTIDFMGQTETLSAGLATVICDTFSDWQTPAAGQPGADTGSACDAQLAAGDGVWGYGVHNDGTGGDQYFAEIDLVVSADVLASITSQDESSSGS